LGKPARVRSPQPVRKAPSESGSGPAHAIITTVRDFPRSSTPLSPRSIIVRARSNAIRKPFPPARMPFDHGSQSKTAPGGPSGVPDVPPPADSQAGGSFTRTLPIFFVTGNVQPLRTLNESAKLVSYARGEAHPGNTGES
jgi:hypothetical protein